MIKKQGTEAGAQSAPQPATIESLSAQLEAKSAENAELKEMLQEANAHVAALSRMTGGKKPMVNLPATKDRPATTVVVKHGLVINGEKKSAEQIAADPDLVAKLAEQRSSAIAQA